MPKTLSLLALGSMLLGAQPRTASAATVESLSWLSGCWRQEEPDGYFEEHWTAPAAKTLLQMGRMVSRGKLAFYETLQILETDGRLALAVTINGKRRVEFSASEASRRKVVFDTPPGAPRERLSYEAVSADELHVRLEKTREHATTLDEFKLKRVDCAKALSAQRPAR